MITWRPIALRGAVLFSLALSPWTVQARETAYIAPILTDPAPKQIIAPAPLRLDWALPGKLLWVAGESPQPERTVSGEVVAARGTGSLGMRYPIFQQPGISLTTAPLIRAEAAWLEQESSAQQTIGTAIFEELVVQLPGGLRLNAKAGVGDRFGVSAPNPRGGFSAPAVRGEAGISGTLRGLGGAQTRFNFQLISTRALSVDEGETSAPSSCELMLEIAQLGLAPLRFGGSCPGASGEQRITFAVGGRF
jgi:hypothetical protein